MRTGSKAGDWRIFEPSNSEGPTRRGKGLDPDREKTCHWSRQGGRFTPKRTKAKKLVSSFAKEERGRLFTWSGGR